MAGIEREQCGETSAGRLVELFTLTNENGLKAKITTFGATLVSLLIPDRRNFTADVVLGFDDPMRYLGDHPYFGCLIGRYANRIAGASFNIAGKITGSELMIGETIYMAEPRGSTNVCGAHGPVYRPRARNLF